MPSDSPPLEACFARFVWRSLEPEERDATLGVDDTEPVQISSLVAAPGGRSASVSEAGMPSVITPSALAAAAASAASRPFFSGARRPLCSLHTCVVSIPNLGRGLARTPKVGAAAMDAGFFRENPVGNCRIDLSLLGSYSGFSFVFGFDPARKLVLAHAGILRIFLPRAW
ncbi:hypothetical protein N7461_000854 [Penicillium sp. DV-2018c]|nr:hypothetical protein N7461_000854 [Penicillium sp. DV-2018c]